MPLSQVVLITTLSIVATAVALTIGYRQGVKAHPENAPKLKKNLPLVIAAAVAGLLSSAFAMYHFGLEAVDQMIGPLILGTGLVVLIIGFVKDNPALKKNGWIGTAMGALLTLSNFI